MYDSYHVEDVVGAWTPFGNLTKSPSSPIWGLTGYVTFTLGEPNALASLFMQK